MAPAWVVQALWSDPSDSDADMRRGVHMSPRGGFLLSLARTSLTGSARATALTWSFGVISTCGGGTSTCTLAAW